jgi:hypothetical protein
MVPVIVSKRIVVPPGICAPRSHLAVSTASIARAHAALTLAVGRPREALGNYFEVVRRPLDLGTILADLQRGAYATAAADPAPAAANPTAATDGAVVARLVADVQLVWSNCRCASRALSQTQPS